MADRSWLCNPRNPKADAVSGERQAVRQRLVEYAVQVAERLPHLDRPAVERNQAVPLGGLRIMAAGHGAGELLRITCAQRFWRHSSRQGACSTQLRPQEGPQAPE